MIDETRLRHRFEAVRGQLDERGLRLMAAAEARAAGYGGSVPALLEIMAVTAFVNARMILMSAFLQPWLKHAAGPQQALMLFLLTDANWLLGARYRSEGGRDLGIYLGSGLILWVVWVAATLPGYLAGALVPEPRRFGLDLLMPIFFSAMLV